MTGASVGLYCWLDKTPYKTHCGGCAAPFYVELGPEGVFAAGGYYFMAPDQVARYRAAEAGGLTVGGRGSRPVREGRIRIILG